MDPEHKYLSHSCVESPDMMNVYNGNVTLDANGRATVELPDYFEALNKDFRYLLTAIGAPGPTSTSPRGYSRTASGLLAGGRMPTSRGRSLAYGGTPMPTSTKVEEDKATAEGKLVARR
jgi:hypothetical protein